MSKFILDTVVLRVFSFAHPQGISLLLDALDTTELFFPPEVYNLDESSIPLNASDNSLSELARGLRYALRQTFSLPSASAQKYQQRLQNTTQIPRHFQAGNFFIESLELEEVPRRENLMQVYGIGRGEAACLTLSERNRYTAVFLSSDTLACRASQSLAIDYLTIPDILTEWINRKNPSPELVQELILGMKNAAFSLPKNLYNQFDL
jgi:hypothetical protein